MAEGARLESVLPLTGYEGSNPSLSATPTPNPVLMVLIVSWWALPASPSGVTHSGSGSKKLVRSVRYRTGLAILCFYRNTR